MGLPQTSLMTVLAFSGLSFALHLSLIVSLPNKPKAPEPARYQKVTVNVQKKPEPKAPEAPPAPKAEEKKKAVEPPKPEKAKVSSQAKENKPTEKVEPVLGLSKESFAPDGKGSFAAPAGNTTNAPDEGKRLSPDEVKKLDQDLSEDAKLIGESFQKPTYTPDAEDAGLEGNVRIEVFVDAEGKVTDAELSKKVGYGMDKLLIEAAMKSRFTPRKDPLGRPIAGWASIKVRLELNQ